MLFWDACSSFPSICKVRNWKLDRTVMGTHVVRVSVWLTLRITHFQGTHLRKDLM